MNEATHLITGDAIGVKRGNGFDDLSGRRFSKLVVQNLHAILKRPYKGKIASITMWRCLCDCGNYTLVPRPNLMSGTVKSCGCGRYYAGNRNPNFKHGDAIKGKHTRTFSIWCGMRDRCQRPENQSWKDYGGRGIEVCDRWQEFKNFLKDMGDVPAGMSLDRIDPNGNYESGNCRWATAVEQARNRRNTKRIEFAGENLCLVEWCERLDLPYDAIHNRLAKGWTPERAFTQPIQKLRNWWCGQTAIGGMPKGVSPTQNPNRTT